VEDGVGVGVGFGGLCVGCGLELGSCDVTLGPGLEAECELLGADLRADLEGDADWADAVGADGDAAASACRL
jgi:hypothetical protein